MRPTGRMLTRDRIDRHVGKGRNFWKSRACCVAVLLIIALTRGILSLRQASPHVVSIRTNIASEAKADDENISESKGEHNNDSHQQQQHSPGYQHLLNVPFYVYEDLIWFNKATVGNLTLDEWMQIGNPKHTDDWWFAKAALGHPMRTHDPSKAKLYVIPALVNGLSDQILYHKKRFCVDGVCNRKLLQFVDEYVSKSPWYRQNLGKDHIVVASHWGSWRVLKKLPHLQNCNQIGYENVRFDVPDRLTLPKIMVGTRCEPESKRKDFAMIASMKNISTFVSRQHICQWLQETNKTVTACGRGDQCPALARARYGFHVRGDTFGSNRLFDTILSGTVPIFTFREQYTILPPFIDWELLSYFADVSDRTQFLVDLHSITSQTQQEYAQKVATMLQNRDLVDWTTPTPFDTYMYAFARTLVPDRQPPRIAPSHFSALRLDVIEKWV